MATRRTSPPEETVAPLRHRLSSLDAGFLYGERPDQPFIYRGFQIIDQEKVNKLRGDQLRKWNENGILALIYAHLFSLELMRNIFARQTQLGKGPGADAPAASEPAPANA